MTSAGRRVTRRGAALGAALIAGGLWLGAAPAVEAQAPIRIGATLALTGTFAVFGQNQHRGYQLCFKHVNDRGGVLGRRIALVHHDDESRPAAGARLYEQLITQDRVDLIIGPYSSPITEAAAEVSEKFRMPMVASGAAATSIFKRGRRYGVDSRRFYEMLGRSTEFVYGVTPWVPELVEIRAGGLIPIARQYPGAREFVETHRKEFPGADLSYHTAAGYAGCEILVDAIRRAGSLDGERIRDALLRTERNTVFGAFRVDRDGAQVAHRLVMFQVQDGKKVIIWPEELAQGQARFPTPPWSQRP